MAEEINSLLDGFRNEADVFKKARILHTLRTIHLVPLISLSRTLGIKPSYLSHYLRILRLPPMVIDGYYGKSVTLSHLFIISRLSTPADMQEVYEQILTQSLSTSELEQIVRERLYNIKSEGIRMPADKISFFKETMKARGIDAIVTQTRVRSTLTLRMKGTLHDSSQKLKQILSLLGAMGRE